MDAYSEDPKTNIAEAIGRGMPTAETACTFGASVSSVKRYVVTACEGASPRPEEASGLQAEAG